MKSNRASFTRTHSWFNLQLRATSCRGTLAGACPKFQSCNLTYEHTLYYIKRMKARQYMRNHAQIVRVAFTYIGTVVGAGFASGQEILQFFTRYGSLATLTIALSTVLFIWIGIQLMLMA